MYIVTGGAGFIGSALLAKLNSVGIENILLVDSLGKSEKWKNIQAKSFIDLINPDNFLTMILEDSFPHKVEAVIHLGASTSTTDRDADTIVENNFQYSKSLAKWALANHARFVYASTAATYGDGSLGFSDDIEDLAKLRPLNIYGYSKHLFDLWALKTKVSSSIVGLKFFNVFGPNEYSKGEMASVVYKAFHQIIQTGSVKLFKSYDSHYPDGGQKRDFIYVKDCTEVIWWLLNNPQVNGIFNLGTGQARTWVDLAQAIFKALGKKPKIEFIEMPENIKNHYQNFTEAKMEKLRKVGYLSPFFALEQSIDDYVKNYLISGQLHY